MAEVGAPFNNAVAITASDSTVYSPPLKAIYVGGVGDLTLDFYGAGTNIVIKAPPVGTLLRVVVRKVKAATTATLLIGLW